MRAAALAGSLALGGVLFLGGFYTHRLLENREGPLPPTYVERLEAELGLDEAQQREVRTLLDEEDALIRESLEGDEGQALKRRIGTIRREISDRILKILTDDQKKRYRPAPAESWPTPKDRPDSEER